MERFSQFMESVVNSSAARPAVGASASALLVCLIALGVAAKRAHVLRGLAKAPADDGAVAPPAGAPFGPWPQWAVGISLAVVLVALTAGIERARHALVLAVQVEAPVDQAKLIGQAFSDQLSALSLGALVLLLLLPLATLAALTNRVICLRGRRLLQAARLVQSVDAEPAAGRLSEVLRQNPGPPLWLGPGVAGTVLLSAGSALRGVANYSPTLHKTFAATKLVDLPSRARLSATGAALAESELAATLITAAAGVGLAAISLLTILRLGTAYERRCRAEGVPEVAAGGRLIHVAVVATLVAAAGCLVAARPYSAERSMPLPERGGAGASLSRLTERQLPSHQGPDDPGLAPMPIA